ncbi:MAG: drug resistance transporter, EmrB/QacA subfamily [Solirubrobacterales bacterium]|nr:drug resistance transporter, EmrB/QacA subfamily [Solirubrobacterales bacterium]
MSPENVSTPAPGRWTALILLAGVQFMVVLDASIVNVALPTIKNSLHFSQDNLQWVVNAYTLTFGGFLLLGGRVADLLGRRKVFMVGLTLFAVASLAGGLSPSTGFLTAARAVQGLGAAIVSPAALAIVTTTFTEGSERNKALGIWGAVAGAGGAAGVLLGGILTSGLGWEWVFFVNVPIGALAVFLAPRLLRESRLPERSSIDVAGALTITAGLVVLVYGLVNTEHHGWGSTRTIVTLAIAVALIAAFVVIEQRRRDPLIRLGIFRNRSVTSSNVVGLLVGASLFSMFFFISLYLQQVLGYSALRSGVSYLPLAVGIIVAAGTASQLVTRLGPKPVLVFGLLLVSVGLILFTGVSPHGSFGSDVLLPSVVVAFGLGFAFVPLTISAVAGVAGSEAGLASGLINTAQQVGGALGLAVLSTIANTRTNHVLASAHGRPDVKNALTEGFKSAFTVGAGFAIAGVVLALLVVRHVPPSEVAADGVPVAAGA